ncbi:STAS/SEC14 domain-containing protein [Paraburkholderia sp. A1RI-2L]|uniref:STAS/SEC14 domain-containing protein n=1 Tax=Paraburkholderia sp. A1RI-2L TaxID=3028367 RepID=UPI003B775A1F
MIQILEGFPANVVAVSANGKLAREDYERVLIPAVEAALVGHEKIRVYYELGPDFISMEPGAAWEDLKLGASHYLKWEGIAVVTDHEWIRHTIDVFRFLIHGQVRTYPMSRASEARDWIVKKLDRNTIRLS